MKRLCIFILPYFLIISAYAKEVFVDGNTYRIQECSKTAGLCLVDPEKEIVEIPSEIIVDSCTYRVTSIQKNAFTFAQKVKKVIIPSSVKCIEKKAFNYCGNLQTVDILGDIKVNPLSFDQCRSLLLIRFLSAKPNLLKGAFKHCEQLQEIHIPVGCGSYYEKQPGIKSFLMCSYCHLVEKESFDYAVELPSYILIIR